MKHEIISVKPDDVVLENKGAEYSPSDTNALRASYEVRKGWDQPPLVYWNPWDKKLHCMDGNHRLMVLRMRGWGDTAIGVLKENPPKEALRSERNLRRWATEGRVHTNSKRRIMDREAEWKAIFEYESTELGMTQREIAASSLFDKADVNRLLLGKYGKHAKETGERQKKARKKALEISNFPKILHAKLMSADKGEERSIKELQMAFWSIGRKLLALGVSLPDPGHEDPWEEPFL